MTAAARRPFDGEWKITGDQASHAEYGVGPASDYGLNSDTPIMAPFGGSVDSYWSITGGLTTHISTRLSVGHAQVWLQHQSSLTAAIEDGLCDVGEHIGYSGNTGSRTSGPHLHTWVNVDGVRMTFEHFMALLGDHEYSIKESVVGGDIARAESEREDMKHLFVTDSVDGNGVPGWMLLNPRTGRTIHIRKDAPSARELGDSWARVWGSPQRVSRQDVLNALDAIKKTL